jgi:hypothetical protein
MTRRLFYLVVEHVRGGEPRICVALLEAAEKCRRVRLFLERVETDLVDHGLPHRGLGIHRGAAWGAIDGRTSGPSGRGLGGGHHGGLSKKVQEKQEK